MDLRNQLSLSLLLAFLIGWKGEPRSENFEEVIISALLTD